MDARTQVHLTDSGPAVAVPRIEQDADLDSVSGGERNIGEQCSGGGVFTAQRLTHIGEFGDQRGQQRPRHQLGHPAAVVADTERVVAQRTPVETLDQVHPGVAQQRREQCRDRAGVRIVQVGIDEDNDIAGGHGQRSPQHLALAGTHR